MPDRSADPLTKIYVEPTNRCNLSCVTCIRHSWDEKFENLSWPDYGALIAGLGDFPDAKTIAFAGFGEPLTHPRFPDMVALAHSRGLRTEMTSNAMLLTASMADRLIDAGLDQFTVSIDGTSSESHGAVRPGASLDAITANVKNLGRRSVAKRTPADGGEALIRKEFRERMKNLDGGTLAQLDRMDGEFSFRGVPPSAPSDPLRIGIEFVAMKSNIHELPGLQKIAEEIRASYIIVSNVLPYTAGLQDEILYSLEPTSYEGQGSDLHPHWIFPKMDWNRDTLESIGAIASQQSNLSYLDINLNQRNNYCPFIQPGSLAVSCHGGVSPCPPLLHSYTCYIRDRRKFFRRCEYGNLKERSLKSIWTQPDYTAFRERVRRFDFSPCTDCGGCEFAETNETDCQGNPFAVCGDCLWARGVLRCA